MELLASVVPEEVLAEVLLQDQGWELVEVFILLIVVEAEDMVVEADQEEVTHLGEVLIITPRQTVVVEVQLGEVFMVNLTAAAAAAAEELILLVQLVYPLGQQALSVQTVVMV
jgi:hypothetical protein